MIPKNILKLNKGLTDWCILQGYRGSQAHGTYIPNTDPNGIDDKDIMSICVPTEDYYLGLREYGSRGTVEIKQECWDIVIYEVRKFIGMLANGNPNVLAILWLERPFYTKVTPAGKMIIDNRDLFATKQVYNSFIGYAQGQLHRMTHMKFEGYMGSKRKALVEKHGYDSKNAAHMVRLLRMGIEFLSTGEMKVLRPDAKELIEIKKGERKLTDIQIEAGKLFESSRTALINSPLPVSPDMDKINELCIAVIKESRKL